MFRYTDLIYAHLFQQQSAGITRSRDDRITWEAGWQPFQGPCRLWRVVTRRAGCNAQSWQIAATARCLQAFHRVRLDENWRGGARDACSRWRRGSVPDDT